MDTSYNRILLNSKKEQLLIYVKIHVNIQNIMPSEEPDECGCFWGFPSHSDWEGALKIFWNKINKQYLDRIKGYSGTHISQKRLKLYAFYCV